MSNDEEQVMTLDENKLRRIWWIASYPKSGNTWVRMFVNAYVSGFPLNLNSAWQYATGDLQPHTYQLTAAEPITEMSDIDMIYYRPAVLMNAIKQSFSRDLVLKTHNAKIELDGIPLIPPRLTRGALYIIRDPRDVAISFADHVGVDIDQSIDRLADNRQTLQKKPYNLYHFMLSWSSHVDSWTVGNKDVETGVARYEDMVGDKANTFQGILRALGIDPSNEGRFKFAMEQTDFDRLQSLEDENGFREKGNGEKFFRRGKVDGWRDVLSGKQVRRIEKSHAGTMERWNYKCVEIKGRRRKRERRGSILGRIKSRATGSVSGEPKKKQA